MFPIYSWQKCLFFCLMLSTSVASATITIVSGGGQTVTVGQYSEPITFKVVDALGNPVTVGTSVDFELSNDQGDIFTPNLSADSDETDATGVVTTQVDATHIVADQYTLTASTQLDTTTESASTTIKIEIGAPVALTVVVGENQTIPAGNASDRISFKLTDDEGNAVNNKRIDFTLSTPLNESSRTTLSPNNAVTDTEGLVHTNILSVATDMIGTYLVTATLLEDNTITADASVTVEPGVATKLTFTSGGSKAILMGDSADPLTFELTDKVGNPITGKRVDFSLTTPSGYTSNQGLLPAFATTNLNGEVETQLNTGTLDEPGTHTITATLAADDSVKTQVVFAVIEETPDLPSLGFCGAINLNGLPVHTMAICNGGISVQNGFFEQEATVKRTDFVFIQGVIKVDDNHIGQLADIVVVAGYKPLPPADQIETFFMLNGLGQIQEWDLDIASLVAFKHSISLSSTQIINVYNGNFMAEGTLRIFFGYRLTAGPATGFVIFNENQTINVEVNK